MPIFALGIDTSNYKTSIAVTDSRGEIVFERSEFLKVPLGKKGLRQSDVFFKHSNLLPIFIEEVFKSINPSDISAIGVSARPRNVSDSYMPCFLAGLNTAKQIGSALCVPVYEFSHQEGHAAAILEDTSLAKYNLDRCVFFHLSGGTTEFLISNLSLNGYDMEIVGGTKDISIGQLFDRIGVALGYTFPAGKDLDELALKHILNTSASKSLTSLNLDIQCADAYFNLSGIETKIMRILDDVDTVTQEAIVSALFNTISNLLYKSILYISKTYNINDFVISGGVASSQYLRTSLETHTNKDNINIVFGSSKLSGDNAVGISRLTYRINRRTYETGNCFTNK
ncbi:MAG: O-sialoglycoprotein endopeptidase [Clostridiales bacterium]|nr:O-sialoglycoprotein endopeptidase [Clostridiales bacterium]